jgi:hypothetical protein
MRKQEMTYAIDMGNNPVKYVDSDGKILADADGAVFYKILIIFFQYGNKFLC